MSTALILKTNVRSTIQVLFHVWNLILAEGDNQRIANKIALKHVYFTSPLNISRTDI